jgi:hypothetical protein
MSRLNPRPPLHPIHPRTTAEVAGGTPVVVRDAGGGLNKRIATTPVVHGEDFLVVWVTRPEEFERALHDGDVPDQVPWPAEDVWIPGEEPQEEAGDGT